MKRISAVLASLILLVAPPCLGAATVLTLSDLSAFPYAPEGYDTPMAAGFAEAKPEKKKKSRPVIPAWILKLDGTRVTVQGFMVPFDVEEDGVKSFNLVKNIMMCCFGLAPQLNEMVYCDMVPGQKAKFFVNVPIDVEGVIHVGEIREDGYLIGIYRMQVDKTERSKNPDPALMRATGPRPSPFSKGPPKWMPQSWGPPASR